MSELGFEILLEDEHCLGVVKPSGIATQAPPGIESLERRIKRYLAGESLAGGDPGGIYLGIPHRLDRAASGVMLFAKTRRAARHFSKQFERRRVKKLYWAAVERIIEPRTGTWTDYLRKVYGQPQTAIVQHTHPDAQQATLHYRTVGYHPGGAWLEIELETGRTHQVRIQCASRGHAVVGDALYGAMSPFGPRLEDERLHAIALHARSLTFWHPGTRIEITLDAPPGPAWDELQLTPVG